MNPMMPAIRIDPELTEPPLPPAPNVRETRNGAAIGRTSVAAIQITDAATAPTMPTRALLR